ncbi:hypothetical protein MKW92_015423 [Papaver armeniacum]|nr:hypothetical protein MKW92_015423 [Papaver armeniacum]
MPLCDASRGIQNGIKIFYRTYGHGPNKVLIIEIRRNDSFVLESGGGDDFNGEDGNGIEVCAFDNRGMGQSSIPTKKSEYTTTNMAKDALALMDHLGWLKAYVFGHSMGKYSKSSLLDSISALGGRANWLRWSLALLNATGGGFECFPKVMHFQSNYNGADVKLNIEFILLLQIDSQMLSIALRFLKAKTPEQSSHIEVNLQEYLSELVGLKTRREILYQEYVKGISSSGMQSNYGFEGQLNALTSKDIEAIKSAGFLISVIHGRKLAEKMQPYARMIDLHGGHLVSHERPKEVNQALNELIQVSDMKLSPHDWSNFPKKGGAVKIDGHKDYAKQKKSRVWKMLAKLNFVFLYLRGLFIMAFEQGRRIFKNLRPARVGDINS